MERMESAPFLLRGQWEEELETVFLDDLEFVWGPRIRLLRIADTTATTGRRGSGQSSCFWQPGVLPTPR
ncbi:hypothetical protein ACWF2L_12275 [Streptomyces anulatus]